MNYENLLRCSYLTINIFVIYVFIKYLSRYPYKKCSVNKKNTNDIFLYIQQNVSANTAYF